MSALPPALLRAASAAGRQLQPAHAARLAAAMRPCAGPGNRMTLLALVAAPGFAVAVEPLLDLWEAHPAVSGELLGLAVHAAAIAHDDARTDLGLELVVSGPSTPVLNARRTEQVLLELLNQAQQEILLVTYSLKMYDALRQALRAALERGVTVTVLAEDRLDQPSYGGDPAAALAGLAVTRLRWPVAQRKKAWASLHAKVVVVDRRAALVTSANLSEVAAGDSLEAGFTLCGGDYPRLFAEHIDRLRADAVLVTA